MLNVCVCGEESGGVIAAGSFLLQNMNICVSFYSV